MSRLSLDAWGLGLAELTARRGTCLRRQVGCVLLDAHGHVLATGYNGVATGQAHCNERVLEPAGAFNELLDALKVTYPHACPGVEAPSGTQLDSCRAIHAEQNALLQCHDVGQVHTCCVTTSPCVTCTKLLLNTGCQRIVFRDTYPHVEARELWEAADRAWMKLPPS